MRKKFTTPLTNSSWQVVEKIIGKQRNPNIVAEPCRCYFGLNYTGVQWREMKEIYPSWEKRPKDARITADNGYKLTFIEHIKDNFGWKVKIAQKQESTKGIIPQKIGATMELTGGKEF